MSLENEIIIGKKGEILPKKKLRQISGFFPGDKVLIRASKNEMVIKKIYTVDEAFDLPRIDSDTPKNIKKQIKEEISRANIWK